MTFFAFALLALAAGLALLFPFIFSRALPHFTGMIAYGGVLAVVLGGAYMGLISARGSHKADNAEARADNAEARADNSEARAQVTFDNAQADRLLLLADRKRIRSDINLVVRRGRRQYVAALPMS